MEWSLCCRASRCSSAEEGQTRQAGPRAVKEKNIPRPANCCSQLPPPLLLGVKKKKNKKKTSASSSGRCKRMQNFNHLLHQPGLPQAKFAGTRQWHHGKGVVGSPHAFSVRYREVKASSVSLPEPGSGAPVVGVGLGVYCLVPAQARCIMGGGRVPVIGPVITRPGLCSWSRRC